MLAGVASALSLQLDHVDTDLTHGCQYFNVLNNGTDKAAEVPGTRLVGYNIHLEDVKSISWEINRNGGWHPMKQSESYRNGRSQIRFCAGWVPRETENGWGVSMDVIPTFDGVEYPQYAWFNATWAYRVNCTINTTVSSSLINFPAHCIMNTATLIAAGKMNTSCQDVRVLSSDGVTQLSYEIEACNATNTVLWVNIPATTANGNDTVRIYHGADGVADGQNASDVWTNYLSVWHGASAVDAKNLNNLTMSGANSYQANTTRCKYGYCFTFNSTTGYWIGGHDITQLPRGSANRTISFWGWKTAVTIADDYAGIVYGTNGVNQGYFIYQARDVGIPRTGMDLYGAMVAQLHSVPITMTYYNGMYNGTCEFTMDAATNTSACSPNTGHTFFYVGRRADGAKYWGGSGIATIDELRLANMSFTRDYVTAEYSQTDSISAEQSQSNNDETCVPADHIPECTAPAGWTCGG